MKEGKRRIPDTQTAAAPAPSAGSQACHDVDPARRVSLTDRVEVEVLQGMQDRFAALSKTSVCMCTADGELLTKPSWAGLYSELIATSARGSVTLRDSIRTLACETSATISSVCHEGMVLKAEPIEHEQRVLGYIIVGTRPTAPIKTTTVRALAADFDIDEAALVGAATEVEPWDEAEQQATHAFAESLARTIGTIFGQAELIQRQLADLQTVHELAQALSGTADLRDILDMTARRVVDVLAVKACGIRLLNEETGELVISAVCNLSPEYLDKGPVMLRDNEIDARAFSGETVYIADARTDPRARYPANARREGLVSGLCVPMAHRGKTVGVLRVYTGQRCTFADSAIALARSLASQAAAAIINSQLREAQAADERFRHQMHYAGEIQRRMLPAHPPEHAVLSFGCAYSPAREVGGDGYDFIDLSEGKIGMCIADVVGKGLPAALMLASVRSALRAQASADRDADEVIARVNRHMCRDTLTGEFATLWYGRFSHDGRQLNYCSAGHEPPLLLRSGTFTPLTAGGMVIGVDPSAQYEHGTVDIIAGDVLVLTTDGVTDAMDFDGEAYGRDRLHESILRHARLDAEHLAGQILWDVRRFVGLAEQADDITIVVIRTS